jgi:hypothetical protein
MLHVHLPLACSILVVAAAATYQVIAGIIHADSSP